MWNIYNIDEDDEKNEERKKKEYKPLLYIQYIVDRENDDDGGF